MSGYYNLKQNIIKTIKDNGRKEITGQTLQVALVDMINSIGANYQLAGIATPSTNPGAVDANVFYFASTQGTYVNFNSIVVGENELAALYKGASDVWYKWHICSISAPGLSEIENNSIVTAMLKDKSVTNAKIADYAISAKQLDAALWVALSSIGINGASFLGIISSVDDMPKKGLINRVTGQLSYDYDANGFYIVDFSKFSDVENGQYVILKNFNGGGLWGDSLRIKKNEGDVAAIIANGSFGNADAEYVDLFHFNIAAAGSGSSEIADGSITTAKLADEAVTSTKIADGSIYEDHFGTDLYREFFNLNYFGLTYKGLATTSTDPIIYNLSPTRYGFFIAAEVGTYTNFKKSGTPVSVTQKDLNSNIVIIKWGGAGWVKELIPVPVSTGTGTGEIADGSITLAKLSSEVLAKINAITEYLPLAGGTMTGDIITPSYADKGIRPSVDNGGQIGNPSYHFYSGYINNLYIGSSSSRIYESSGYLTLKSSKGANIENDLSVSGNVYATSFNQTSDYRLKNILEENIVLPLDTIADAPSIRYNLKNDKKETTHLGTIAQYWANVTGDDVAKKNSEGYYSLESTSLSLTIGISLAKHLREANDKIASLEERLKALEDKLNI